MTVSRRSAEIRPFVVMDIVARAKALEAEGRDIVRLEIGDPDFPTPGGHHQGRRGRRWMRAAPTTRSRRACRTCARRSRDHYRDALRRRGRPREHRGHAGHLAGDAAHVRRPARPGRRGDHAGPVLPRVPQLRHVPRGGSQAVRTRATDSFRYRLEEVRAAITPSHQGDHDQLARATRRAPFSVTATLPRSRSLPRTPASTSRATRSTTAWTSAARTARF